jgi:excinuclease ABC subunit C
LPGDFSLAGAPSGLMRRNGPAVLGTLPSTPGVYRFRDDRDRVLYVGRASMLRSRVASYWSDLRERDHLAAMVARIARIEAVSCDSAHEAAWLERNLLEASLPPWNRTPGQESAVYIRMDSGPVTPGLSVAFRARPAEQVRYFGPYLGSLRVRQAASALHRILPLTHASDRLRGAERDLARARGVAGDDRTALIGSITAILERQPTAVSWAQSQLEQLRDRAASVLAYEFAARVQAEIKALSWVSCPQRVTTMDAANLTISGWSRGVLVQFLIHDGRLRGWSQRSCGLASVTQALSATPAAWRDFTQRNAELAASMAQPQSGPVAHTPFSGRPLTVPGNCAPGF